jgi:predicted metal-dependent HD superfamily phosphohydrolase
VDDEERGVASLAAWFHDAVYAVGFPETNEAESAALASRELTRLGAPADLRARVAALVLDTATHDASSSADTGAAGVVVHDADLWVLSAPVDRFDEYCRQVREEYAHVSSPAYAPGALRGPAPVPRPAARPTAPGMPARRGSRRPARTSPASSPASAG